MFRLRTTVHVARGEMLTTGYFERRTTCQNARWTGILVEVTSRCRNNVKSRRSSISSAVDKGHEPLPRDPPVGNRRLLVPECSNFTSQQFDKWEPCLQWSNTSLQSIPVTLLRLDTLQRLSYDPFSMSETGRSNLTKGCESHIKRVTWGYVPIGRVEKWESSCRILANLRKLNKFFNLEKFFKILQ